MQSGLTMKNHEIYPVERAGHLSGAVRKLFHPPDRLLRPYILERDTVLDFGCGPGYFSLPMARIVGEGGTVIAVDVQEGMLDLLKMSAEQLDLTSRFLFQKCTDISLELEIPAIVSFILAFHVMHETGDPSAIFSQMYRIMRQGGHLLIAEPWIVVGSREFSNTLDSAIAAGFSHVASPFIFMSRCAVLRK
jgi:ubiquinone/menaquinone biosynthesis C-methylase UbiE